MRVSYVVAIIFAVQCFGFGPSLAEDNANIPIYIQEKEVGEVTQLNILSSQDGVMKIRVVAVFESFTQNLDTILEEKGNLTGKCPNRIFWKGRSSIRGPEQNKLHMKSRLGYELYVCVPPTIILGVRIPTEKLTTHVLGDARMIEWTLSVDPARVDELGIRATLKNIVGYPEWLEVLFGLHVTRHIKVSIPEVCNRCKCSEIIDQTGLSLEEIVFSVEDVQNLKASAIFSARSELGDILPCITSLGS